MNQNNVNVVELTEVEAVEPNTNPSFFNHSTIDLISDMPIELNVEIGGFSLSVKELYQLKPGMVMPLGMKLNAPLNICLGENVVAEGVLVAADEHYAVEITKVAEIKK